FLACVTEEGTGVLKVIALHDAAERLAGRQSIAVAGVDEADLPLGNSDQGEFVDPVLPAPQSEVDAAAQQVGLVAGLAVLGDDVSFSHGAVMRPEFFDNADLLVGNSAKRKPRQQR